MDNQTAAGLSLFLVGAVLAPFLWLIGPLLMAPGLVVLLLADRKTLPCKNCNVPFKISRHVCPKCGAPRTLGPN